MRVRVRFRVRVRARFSSSASVASSVVTKEERGSGAPSHLLGV